MIEAFLIHVIIVMLIYVLVALSLNFALGNTGIVNLAQIAFFGIGAYTSVLLAKAGVPFVAAFVLAGIVSGILGFAISIPARRIRGEYMALATLAFHFLAISVFVNWREVTNGPFGISAIPRPEFFGFVLEENFHYLIFTIIVFAICVFALSKIIHSPFGRIMGAIRDDEIAARVLGKNTLSVKSKVMFISTFFAGIAGALLAHYLTFISPSSFEFPLLVFTLSVVIVGGLASIRGTLIAGVVLFAIPEMLRFLDFPSSIIGPVRMFLFALAILLVVLFFPKGFDGKVDLE